jgi:ubiquinone/menaquinone biosynthesis C-methylase UbiE
MADSQIRALQGYVELLKNNALAHVVRTANLLGILNALVDGQKQIDEIAKRCRIERNALEPFMAALVQTPLVEQYGEYYALSQVARMIPPQLSDLGDAHWQHLGKFLRTGQALPDLPNLAATEDDYLSAALLHEWMQTPAALSAVSALDIGRHRRGMRVLELGCASGVFSLTFAHNDPTSRFILVDSPERLSLARTGAESLEVSDRIEFVVQDYLTYEPEPASVDLVILASVIHRHDETQVQELIQRGKKALVRAGELCIVDVFPGQDRGNRFRAVFELELAMRTSSGQAHSAFLLQDWLRSAGFGDIQFTHLPAPPYLWGLIVAPLL